MSRFADEIDIKKIISQSLVCFEHTFGLIVAKNKIHSIHSLFGPHHDCRVPIKGNDLQLNSTT